MPNRLLAFCAALFIAVSPLGRPIESYDTGWNVRLGQWVREHRALPDRDPFLSTTHHPVPPDFAADQDSLTSDYTPLSDRFHWLGQVLLSLAYDGLGFLGLTLFRGGCFVLALAGIAWSLHLLEVPALWKWAALAGAAAWIGPLALARPSAISIALFAGTTALWLSACRLHSPGRAWLAVAILPIWAQLHGGFILGQAIAAAFIAGNIVERFLPQPWRGDRPPPLPLPQAVILGLVAASAPFLVHPAGTWTALETLKACADTAARLAPDVLSAEMAPASITKQPATYVLGVMALLLAPRILRRHGMSLVFLSLGSLAAAILSQRNTSFFAATSLPVIAAGVAGLLAESSASGAPPGRPLARRRWTHLALPLAVSLALAVNVAAELSRGQLQWRIGLSKAHPDHLASFLRRTPPPGLPFNVYNQGSFFVWQVPEVQWFVDGRFNNARFLYVYLKFRKAQAAGARDVAWRRWFRHYDVDWAVVPVVPNVPDIELIVLLSRAPEWWLVRIEDGTTVFVRQKPPTAPYLARHRLSAVELRQGLERLFPVVASMAEQAGFLIAADYLVSSGSFAEARQLLVGIPQSSEENRAAQERLRRWPEYVGPVVAKMARLEGGQEYRRMLEELAESRESAIPARLQPRTTKIAADAL